MSQPSRAPHARYSSSLACWLASVSLGDRSSITKSGQSGRSEEHTSELQSPCNLVCRLLLEKKKKKQITELASYKITSRSEIISSNLEDDKYTLTYYLVYMCTERCRLIQEYLHIDVDGHCET